MEERNLRILKYGIIIFTVLNVLLFIAYIIVGFTVFQGSACEDVGPLFGNGLALIQTYSGKIIHDFESKSLTIYDDSRTKILTGSFGKRIDFIDDYKTLDVKRLNTSKPFDYVFSFKAKSRAADIEFIMKNSDKIGQTEISCDSYEWKVSSQIPNYAYQEFEDCFNLDNSFWYGQTESYNQQYWPINAMTWTEYKPYLTGFIDNWGSILERYWLSSSGVAIIVDQATPLFLLKNSTTICLLASSKEPYDDHKVVNFKYDLCRIDTQKSKQDYLNKLHLYVMNEYFAIPVDIPDERMFRWPIWSTWANFKANINESVIKKYAIEIKNNNYPNSQLEIDDKWSTTYGDFDFDQVKFPNVSDFVTELNELGYRTTLWIHPFTNLDSMNVFVIGEQFNAVKNKNTILPGLTSWWQGPAAIMFDATNPNATDWFASQLEKIKTNAKIDSFKFDAGELNWLPRNFELNDAKISPDQYCSEFARMAARFGKFIEVRVGCQTQDLPIFVRMLDKDSNWGYDNGLKSVLTTALVMSILGYPFILPDMIGGNAYFFDGSNIDFNGVAYPEYQLYVRWAQMTAFLPSMQFSIPPWYYDDKTQVPVNTICKKYVDLHENLIFPLMQKYGKIATETGEPIIRPIWWLDNSDLTSHQISDEFLIGMEILVAPITDKDKYERDVYLPTGNWRNEDGSEFTGPIWLRNYPAPIENIPYFFRS